VKATLNERWLALEFFPAFEATVSWQLPVVQNMLFNRTTLG
jgi:hypothetical protein